MEGGQVERPREVLSARKKPVAVKEAEAGERRGTLRCRVGPEVANGHLGGNIWSDFENLGPVLVAGPCHGAGGKAAAGQVSEERGT